ncbi:MAG: hypothetical protein BWX55_00154 [Deltaproteobacteria bacterium ADurb.Bin022]|nr:MAG: hypothetical protein BWX55_00154 [Deltaproteobacteria bacterium ADurb.Bin022]
MKETLRISGKDGVESSLGWKIEFLSPEILAYREGEKSIRLEMEDRPDAQGEREWILYTPARWAWRENDGPLAREKISEILKRIDLAFWKLDRKIKEII